MGLRPQKIITLKLRKKKNLTISLICSGLAIILIFLSWWTKPVFHQTGTIKIWDRNNILLYESAENVGKKIPINYNQLPAHLVNAVISSEDITFWSNPGIDFNAIIRSSFLNYKNKKIVSGASTITQQLAKISVISSSGTTSPNLIRKIREILIALRLTASYSKEEILTMYLNQVYFGNLSYGIQSASLTYFNKDVSQLSLAESALLAGLISSPNNRDPFTNIERAKQRQAQILDLMAKQGFISQARAEEAKREEIVLAGKNSDIKAPHFVQYILQEIERIGIENKQGINIYTTLDYPSFKLSEDIAKRWVEKLKDEHNLSNASLVLIGNKTGEILVMLGGINYFDVFHAGQVNMATSLRQPGSALKPVTYATSFMQGYTPATLIYDVKKVYKTKKGEGFTPGNYDGRYHGLVLAREALASSYNLPAVEMLNRIGIDNFLITARKLGITTFTQKERYDLSITLGGGEVKLLELTNLFASFARGGEYLEPYAIQTVSNDDGKVLYEHRAKQGKQALGNKGKQISYLITNILSDPKARIPGFGEKNPLNLSHPVAVKTGTTTDWHDNWTIGYTPSFTTGVWVGNNNNSPMKDITGVTGAGPIWNQFFEEFLKGKPIEQFDKPKGLKKVEICTLSGELPSDLCPNRSVEIFIEGTEPKSLSNLHKKFLIDKRNGLLATEACPRQFTEEKIFIDYPPEVYSWAKQENLEVIPTKTSPLCGGPQEVPNNTYLEIIYPRSKAVFESAPLIVNNEAITFEVSVSTDISKVLWYLDGQLYEEVLSFPYSVSWTPLTGKHTVLVQGITKDNKVIKSNEVEFSVVQ